MSNDDRLTPMEENEFQAGDMPTPPRQKGGMSCLKMAGFGCLGVILLMVIAGMLVGIFWESILRQGGAAAIEVAADHGLEMIQVPEEDAVGIKQAIKEELTDRIRNEELTAEETFEVMGKVAESPAAGVVAVRGFENHYFSKSGMAQEEADAAHQTASRFSQGLLDGRIDDPNVLQQLMDIAIEKKTGQAGEDVYELKQSLTPAEVQQCLDLMREAADRGGVEAQVFEIDYEGMARDALRRAVMEVKDPGSSTEPPVVPPQGELETVPEDAL